MKWLRIHFLVVSCGSVRCFACFPHSTSSHPRFVSPVEPGRRRPTRPREDGRIRGTSVKSEEEARTPVDSPFTVITSLRRVTTVPLIPPPPHSRYASFGSVGEGTVERSETQGHGTEP